MAKLGVNIDHVATLRETRKGLVPDPVEAALVCEEAGCDSIVCHLREDRRHIKDADVVKLRKAVKTRLNLEMSVSKDIVEFACRIKPNLVTLVPERRRELTTEGGLDVVANEARIRSAVELLKASGIGVSLFINPLKSQIDASRRVGAKVVELHTGEYADAKSDGAKDREFGKIVAAAKYALERGFEVNAGHGLNYENARKIAHIDGIIELNIGHSIVSRALFAGLGEAVKKMLETIR